MDISTNGTDSEPYIIETNPFSHFFRDRRVFASEEYVSTRGANTHIYRGNARGVGACRRPLGLECSRLTRVDRSPGEIFAIILHHTGGNDFLSSRHQDRININPANENIDRNDLRLDKVAAHFVILNNGTVFYTHDLEYIIDSAGGRRGIDIEFAGNYSIPSRSSFQRLSRESIISARNLIRLLKREIPSISHIHPHGQVQAVDTRGSCGVGHGHECGKLHICPGPDIWVNVGEWATIQLRLSSIPRHPYQDNGISGRMSDQSMNQFIRENPPEITKLMDGIIGNRSPTPY